MRLLSCEPSSRTVPEPVRCVCVLVRAYVLAAKNGQTDEVVKLHDAGGKVNFYDPEMLQSTPLQWAANNGHVDTIQKLVDLGASVYPTNQHGWTALHHASNWGYVDCVKKLLDLGADPYAQSEGGHTPMEAVWGACLRVVGVYMPPCSPALCLCACICVLARACMYACVCQTEHQRRRDTED